MSRVVGSTQPGRANVRFGRDGLKVAVSVSGEGEGVVRLHDGLQW